MCDGEPTLSALRILADHASDGEGQLEALLALGISEPDAYRFMNFMPSGLARVIVEGFGIEVADEASVALGDDQFISFSLARQPLYGMAVDLGRAHQERGVLPHDIFRKIVEGTAEINSLDNLLNAGGDPEGSVIAVCFCDSRLANFVIDPSAPGPRLEAVQPAGPTGLSRLWKRWRRA
jgi:hypothetical protein